MYSVISVEDGDTIHVCTGVSGPPGSPGPQGETGPQGTGLEISGQATNFAALPEDAVQGQVWVTLDDSHAWLSDGEGDWTDLGTLFSQGGDMQAVTYDPTGVEADVFNAENLYGQIDCGTFS